MMSFMTRMLTRGLLCMSLLLISPTSWSGTINIQSYQPSPFAWDMPSISTTTIGRPLQLTVGLNVHYTANPLGFLGTDQFGRSEIEETLQSRMMSELLLSFAPTSFLDIGIAQPLVLTGTGKGAGEGFSGLGDLTGFAVGELRVSIKAVFLRRGPFRIGLQADGTIPTASAEKLAGNGLGGGPRLMMDFVGGPVTVALNVGAYFREKADVGEYITADHSLTGGLGVSVRVNPKFWLQGETYFKTPLGSMFDDNNTVLEYMAGVRWEPHEQFSVSLGGGAGTPIFQGIGTAQFRFYADLRWMMAKSIDDRDGDGINDRLDRCPIFPEDIDGYRDLDGCPDPDNDGDGFLDQADQCPDEAEDKDGFEDDDGCPERDNDGDGIVDAKDKCPGELEDKDGFEDGDGCPEKDNDGDGILDENDQCPNKPETKNGHEDTDGCPDFAGVSVRQGQLVLTVPLKFAATKSDIPAANFAGLRNMATLIKQNKSWKKITIRAHWDGSENPSEALLLTQKQATAILQFLVTEGVDFRRLVAEGLGDTAPIASNATKRGRAKNRRIEFILSR